MDKKKEIPIWEQYTLSVEEACVYFRIGENKLRKIINERPECGFYPVEWQPGTDKTDAF